MNQGVREYLSNTSMALDKDSFIRASAWRHVTLKTHDVNTKNSRAEIVEVLVNDFMERCDPLVATHLCDAVRDEWKELFSKAIGVWNDAQADGSRIKAIRDPDQRDPESWADGLIALTDPSNALPPRLDTVNQRKGYNLTLFPKITRTRAKSRSFDSKGVESTLFRGLAIFESAAIFGLGIDEHEQRPEGIRRISTT